MVALYNDGPWLPAIKIAETPEKIPTPGQKQVWRLYDERGKATVDLLSRIDEDPDQMTRIIAHHPTDHAISRTLERSTISHIEPLLVDVLRDGARIYEPPPLPELRTIRMTDVERLDASVRRLINPHRYHVSLTHGLWELKQQLIASLHPSSSFK